MREKYKEGSYYDKLPKNTEYSTMKISFTDNVQGPTLKSPIYDSDKDKEEVKEDKEL